MKCLSNKDIVNKYAASRKIQVKVSEEYRRATKRTGKEVTHEIVDEKPFFCKIDDELTIVTEEPGEWMVCVVVRNKDGALYPVLWSDLKFA